MSARSAQALIEGGPQRIFGDFLIVQKVTTSPGGPQAASPLQPQQHLGHTLSKQPRPGQGLGKCISVSPYLYQQ